MFNANHYIVLSYESTKTQITVCAKIKTNDMGQNTSISIPIYELSGSCHFNACDRCNFFGKFSWIIPFFQGLQSCQACKPADFLGFPGTLIGACLRVGGVDIAVTTRLPPAVPGGVNKLCLSRFPPKCSWNSLMWYTWSCGTFWWLVCWRRRWAGLFSTST